MGLPRFDPLSPGFRVDPYETYARYRVAEPVHFGLPPIASMPRCHYLFRYADVAAVLRDGRFGRQRLRDDRGEPTVLPGASTVIRRVVRRMLLFADPPRHNRLRGLVEAAFSPELHALARQRAEQIAPALLAEALSEPRPDLISGFAVPLPVLVMSEVLGVHPEDRLRIKRWSSDIVAITDLRPSKESVNRASRATAELAEYLRAELRARRRAPREDLLTRLITARVDGSALSDDEILANAVLLLAAGHETTVGLIGNGLKALMDHPSEALRLRSDPELVGRAVEELLRFDSPVQMTFRVAQDDANIGGVRIRRGEAVALVIGSANRDPEAFQAPDVLDLGRRNGRHLAFAAGPHLCLGADVARFEARAAFAAAAPHLGSIRYEPEQAVRTGNVLFRALASLPVRSA